MAQYVVKGGDTLSRIAQQVGYGGDYVRLARENNIPNPNVIRPGQVINYGGGAPAPAPPPAPAPSPQPSYNPAPQPGYSSPGPSGGLNADILRSKFGFNDPNVINNILNNPNERARYEREAGLGSSGFSMPSRPSIDLNDIYTKAMESGIQAVQPELDATAGAVSAVEARIVAKRKALADAEATINDNPYYSEATRTGRIAKLRSAAEADMGNDLNELGIATNKQTAAQNKLLQSKADAQVKVNIANQQYNIEDQKYQQNLQMFSNLLTSGGFENISGGDIAQISQATGMSSSMVQSLLDFQKKKNAPQLDLQTYDDGQQQFVLAIDPGGNIVNRQVIGASKPTKTGGGGSSAASKDEKAREASFYKAVESGQKSLRAGETWGTVWNRIHLLFPEISGSALDTLLGTEWRQAGAYEAYRGKTSSKQYNQSSNDGFNPDDI